MFNELNTYENTIAIQGDFEIQVPTYKIDKKVDMKVLIGILLRSNGNVDDVYRYIDFSYFDKDKICEECGCTRKTLNSKIRYLIKVGIMKIENTTTGIRYYINCSRDGKYHVSISHKKLKEIYDNFDNFTIKVYIVILEQCKYLKNKKSMNNGFLCSCLGYSASSSNNLAKVGTSTNLLHEKGILKKYKKIKYKIQDGRVMIGGTDIYYIIS